MRVAGASDPVAYGVFYLLTDHHGSTNLTIESSGNVLGETRYESGNTPTTFGYTGQRH